jgi:hypothetical protein
MPAQTRARPEPAGEPRPTPVEDVPEVATPAPREPEPQPDEGFGLSRAAEIQRLVDGPQWERPRRRSPAVRPGGAR